MEIDLNGLTELLVSVVPVAILGILTLLLLRFLDRRLVRSIESAQDIHPERKQQLCTIIKTLRWVISVIVVGALVLMLLSRFVDIAPVLASVGVVGLALSLGAQTLAKDLIAGFFVLLENQYGIGDVIQVGDIAGVVEHLTLRVTQLRDADGKLHIIPNGEVRIVSNLTKDWSRAVVDVNVAYEEDIEYVLQVLEEVAADFAQDEKIAPDLLEEPQVLGPLGLGDWSMTVRVMVNTQPGQHFGVGRELKKRVLAACEEKGITLPYPRSEVLVRTLEGKKGLEENKA
jgi:small conductance mechanosensitive channel